MRKKTLRQIYWALLLVFFIALLFVHRSLVAAVICVLALAIRMVMFFWLMRTRRRDRTLSQPGALKQHDR